MNEGFKTFIHNDITWCANSIKEFSDHCDNEVCFRHLSHFISDGKYDLLSMAYFKNTKDCPYYKEKE